MKLAAIAAVALLGGACHAATTPAKIPLTLQVYRHANSCANVATQCLKRGDRAPVCSNFDFNVPDPTITNWGVEGSKDLAPTLPRADAVLTSVLLRAIESGLYMFPKNAVYPSPYIREVDYKPPNVPQSTDEQRAIIEKVDGASFAKRVNFTYEDDPTHECVQGDDTPRCQADWENFLTWLGETLATNPPSKTEAKLKEGKRVRLAIVTHSIMITNEILKQRKHISNNYGFQGNFTFDPLTREITQVSDWKEITLGVKSPCNGRSVTVQDTARCAQQLPGLWTPFQTACVA